MKKYAFVPAFCHELIACGGFAFAQDTAAQPLASDSLMIQTPFAITLKLFAELIIGLAIVIILLILTLWILKYISRFRFPSMGVEPIQVLSLRYLEPKKAIALVRVADRVFIIGVADQALTTLGELSLEEAGTLHLDVQQNQQVFKAILSRFRGKGTGFPS